MKKAITVLSVVLLCLGWYQTVDAVFGRLSKYDAHVKAAETYAEKEIYEDALTEYQAALELKPESAKIKLNIARMQLALNNKAEFVLICESFIRRDTVNQEALELLVDYYDKSGEQDKIVSLLKELRDEHGKDKNIQKLWTKYRGSYMELYYTYEEMKPFYGTAAVVKNEGKYGLINTQGENIFAQEYDGITDFSKEKRMAAVSENGLWYYMNEKNHKKIVPDDSYDFLGIISEEMAVVGKNQKFGYADTDMNLLAKCEWDFASNLYHGVAAVKKGDAWKLLGSDLKQKTDETYEDILVDEAGFCSGQERIFARQKGVYRLLDTDGEQVGELVFEDARPFGEDEMTAVCMDGKWGFINVDGELVIPCEFEDARAFAYTLAPVKKKGKWGYIDTVGGIVIKPQFEDAYAFNQNGTAPVKEKNWFLIQLYALQ